MEGSKQKRAKDQEELQNKLKQEEERAQKAKADRERQNKENACAAMTSLLSDIRKYLVDKKFEATQFTMDSLIPKASVKDLFELTDGKISKLENRGPFGRSKS